MIDALFNRTVAIAQSLSQAGPIQTSYEEKLVLYSLYKQATEGDVSTPRPRLLDLLGRAKWDAWQMQRGLSSRDAKQFYVESMLRTLRRYRDRPQAMALIDELENFSEQVAGQVMDSALTSTDEGSSRSSESATEDESAYDEYEEDEDEDEEQEQEQRQGQEQELELAPVPVQEQVPMPEPEPQESDPRLGPHAQSDSQLRTLGQPSPFPLDLAPPRYPSQRQAIRPAVHGEPPSSSVSQSGKHRQIEATGTEFPALHQASHPPTFVPSIPEYASGPPEAGYTSARAGRTERGGPPASASANLAGMYGSSAHIPPPTPRTPDMGIVDPRPHLPAQDRRLYSPPGRTARYPPSESLAGQAAGGFRAAYLPGSAQTGGLYRPSNVPTGGSLYSYGPASSVGARSGPQYRMHHESRLPRISHSGSVPGSARASAAPTAAADRADAVDMALQRIQASLTGLHERMTVVEQASAPSSRWFNRRGAPAGSGGGADRDGATGALAQLWRVLVDAGQDISLLLGLSSGADLKTSSTSLGSALSNVFLSAPLRISLAVIYLVARLALDFLSVGLLATGVLYLVRRLSGRGDPLLLLRLLARGARALRRTGPGNVAAVAAASTAGAGMTAAANT